MKNVAAYGRVPAQKDAMLREMVAQITHYGAVIQKQKDWKYSGVFIDSGSGRSKLNELLDSCRRGEIDLILVASIDTFALDKAEMLNTFGELRDINVDVHFRKEKVQLLSEDGDMLISALALYVQPPKEAPDHIDLYGFRNDEEADAVRNVFALFFSGLGRIPIANAMNRDGFPGPRGTEWTYCDVKRIMKEDAYRDTLIDAATWDKARDEDAHRTEIYGYRPKGNHRFTDLITCGICGSTFTRRERGKSSLWLCRTYMKKGKSVCASRGIRERVLLDIVGEAGNLDNITVYPDGRLVYTSNNVDFEKRWR